MKNTAMVVVTLVTLATLIGLSESIGSLLDEIPVEVLKTLNKYDEQLLAYNASTNIKMSYNLSSPLEISVDSNSIRKTIFVIGGVQELAVSKFDLGVINIVISGEVQVQDINNGSWHLGKFRAIPSYGGNLTVTFEGKYYLLNDTLTFESNVKPQTNYDINFVWPDSPSDCFICTLAVDRTRKVLVNQFPSDFEIRANEIIYKEAPEIAKRLAPLK